MLVLSLLLVVNIVYTEAQIKVSQSPRSTNRKVGESAIFYCGVGIFEENPGVDVYWWRVGDNEFLQSVPDQRKRFSPMERGQATFQLLNITVADRGLYYCGVKKELGPLLNGTGSTLIVHVSPTRLRIEYNETENNGSEAFSFVCTTAEFYPEQINITWYKNGLMIETGIKTTVQLNANGLHVASSSLEEVSPVTSGTTYTCQASHLTVQTATDFRFIPTRRTNIGGPKGRKWTVVYGSAGGGFLILSFIAITWVIYRRKFAGKRESTKQPPPAEDQVSLNDVVQYAAVNFAKLTKHKEEKVQVETFLYTQTKQLGSNKNPTYAVLELPDSKKTGQFEREDKRSEYAQLHLKHYGIMTEVIYSETKDT